MRPFYIKNSRPQNITMDFININTLIDELFPNNAWHNITYQEAFQAVQNWCVVNNAYYYADDSETFCINTAKQLAQDANNSKVVFDYLS